MTRSECFYSIAKDAHDAKRDALIELYEHYLQHDNISDAERAFLERSVTNAKALTFPAFHPGEW